MQAGAQVGTYRHRHAYAHTGTHCPTRGVHIGNTHPPYIGVACSTSPTPPQKGEQMETIGKTIKKLLIDNNLKQNELAELMGISEQHVSNIITGRRKITFETAVELSIVLKADINLFKRF